MGPLIGITHPVCDVLYNHSVIKTLIFDFDGTIVDNLDSVFAPLKKIIKELKINPGEVAYIGDEARDIEAAKKAGILAVAVTWGFEGEIPLRNEDPDYLLHKPKELLTLVR